MQLAEASERAGGVIHSVRRDGFLLEFGPQSFIATLEIHGLANELGITDQMVEASPRAPRFVLVDGALQKVPLSPPEFLTSSLLSAGTKWSVVRDLFGTSTPPDRDESIADFVRRKFSVQLLDRLIGPFISGIYAGDPERLSVRSAFPQLYEAEKSAGSILRGMKRTAKVRRGPRQRPSLRSFQDGVETLTKALSAKLGPALRLGTEVVSVQGNGSEGNRGYIATLNDNGSTEQASVQNLVFAAPAGVTGRLLRGVEARFDSLLAGIEYAAVAIVSLGYRMEDVGRSLDGFGFLVPRSAGLRVLGTVWNSSLFPNRAPTGHVLLTSFVGGATDPAAVSLSEEELISLVHREIAAVLSIRRPPVFSNVQVYPRALPQYNLGHGERLEAIEQLLRATPGVRLIGNYLRGPAIGACVAQGLEVADAIARTLASRA